MVQQIFEHSKKLLERFENDEFLKFLKPSSKTKQKTISFNAKRNAFLFPDVNIIHKWGLWMQSIQFLNCKTNKNRNVIIWLFKSKSFSEHFRKILNENSEKFSLKGIKYWMYPLYTSSTIVYSCYLFLSSGVWPRTRNETQKYCNR